MNFKHVLLLFLAVGVLFAGPFPEKISGTDLELDDSDGDMDDGWASYANNDGSSTVYVGVEKMDNNEWNDNLDEMNSYYDLDKKSQGGIDYYYVCESASYYYYYSEGYVCTVLFYYNGKAYGSMAYDEGASQSETLDLAIKTGNEVAGVGILGGFCSCPIALVCIGGTLAGVSRIR